MIKSTKQLWNVVSIKYYISWNVPSTDGFSLKNDLKCNIICTNCFTLPLNRRMSNRLERKSCSTCLEIEVLQRQAFNKYSWQRFLKFQSWSTHLDFKLYGVDLTIIILKTNFSCNNAPYKWHEVWRRGKWKLKICFAQSIRPSGDLASSKNPWGVKNDIKWSFPLSNWLQCPKNWQKASWNEWKAQKLKEPLRFKARAETCPASLN